MSIGDDLAGFRIRFPDCTVVAFADLSTGLVFAAETEGKTVQEELDALCELAFQSLAGREASAIGQEFSGASEARPDQAIASREGHIQCFLRAAAPAQEALCLVLTGANNLEAVLAEGQSLLQRLTADA